MKLRLVLSSLLVIVVHIPSVFSQGPDPGLCRTTPPLSQPSAGAHWNGWGASVTGLIREGKTHFERRQL